MNEMVGCVLRLLKQFLKEHLVSIDTAGMERRPKEEHGGTCLGSESRSRKGRSAGGRAEGSGGFRARAAGDS